MTDENENNQGIVLEERVSIKMEATRKEIEANIARYDKLIRERKYDEAERIEREEGLPETRLTGVISDIIKEKGLAGERDLARELIERFAYRKYGKEWIEEYA